MNKLKVGLDSYELNVDEQLRPSIERQLSGTTKMDTEIHSLPIPEKPFLIRSSIMLLRWYRKHISPKLGKRCVFEPSCSHYCELAIREVGLLKGFYLTIKRLHRCHPGAGGVDLPTTQGDKKCNTK